MKKLAITIITLFSFSAVFSQVGHIMQGVGTVNMTMGGAATGQPLDISGAMYWNPAAISTFDNKILKLDLGFFFSSPKMFSSVPENPGVSPALSGTTEDARGVTPLPALGMVWGNADSKHTFGASIYGVSGFGVTFPEEANNPTSPSFDPTQNSNPLNYPQAAGGFGRIESDYILLQVGFTWAYEINEKLSIGVQPLFNYSTLELLPNPTANPTGAGYPSTDKASATGFGAQFGMFYNSGSGFKAGVSYKTQQYLSDFELKNTYLDNSTSSNNFKLNFPSIISLGLGYSTDQFDFALDYRFVDYENTDGFAETGWNTTDFSVNGFGWQNMSVISAGVQFNGIEKIPLRVGYTYNTAAIPTDVAFYSAPATAVIKNAFQLGVSYLASEKITIDAGIHYATSSGSLSGPILNPAAISPTSPYGAVPGSEVTYEATAFMPMFSVSYAFLN